MHIKRFLLISGFLLIITGCNSTILRPSPAVATTSKQTAIPDTTTVVPPEEHPDNNRKSPPVSEIAAPQTTPAMDTHNVQVVPHYHNIWKRIAAGLTLNRHLQKRSVQEKLAWYMRNQDYLNRVTDRARPYIYYIVQQLDKRHMPLDLALLPIVESAYHPFAYSPSKASGIWQFIPSTGRIYGLKQDWWYDGRRDIVAATRAALDYLQKLHDEFNGDWLLALAAYNAGEQNVARAIHRNQRYGKKLDFFSLRLPRETRGYVPSLLAIAELVAHPAQHGISWKPIPNTAYFTPIDTGGQLDLAQVAKLSGQSIDDVYTLNPAFNRWATDPGGPFVLLIPKDKAKKFSNKLSALPKADRLRWTRHIIRRGESIGLIAQHYHISINALKQANGIRGNLIHTGHSLLIPTSMRPEKAYSLSMDARRFRGLKRKGTGQEYIYTVQRGDTLWDIGQQYGISIGHLCAWNGISSRHFLRPGQKLTLWLADDGNAIATAGASQTKGTHSGVQSANNNISVATYTVRNGDSLWLVANRVGTTVAQLEDWNDLSDNDVLRPGRVLKLAGDSDAADGTPGASDSDPADDATQTATSRSYTVKNGDSLWLIAKRYGMTVAQLINWNNLNNSSRLMPGQQLSLVPVSYNASGTSTSSSTDKTTVIKYTVKKGDSLWLISRRFGTTVAQLIHWNKLSRGQQLQPGQKLVLYISEA